ncbi:Ig-like domain-containing protein [Cystobacter fuscus]
MPDAERSSVEVNPAQGVRANGQDTVEIRVTVRTADGTPLEGRAVTVEARARATRFSRRRAPRMRRAWRSRRSCPPSRARRR